MTPEYRDRMRAQFGYDQSVGVQYVRWMQSLLVGEFGWSTANARPVAAELSDVIPRTLLLMSLALAASVWFGILVGRWQARRAGSAPDRAVSTVSFVIFSMPEFWLAMIMLLVFSSWLGWFPAQGQESDMFRYKSFIAQMVERLRHLVLPWATLTLVGTAVFARYQRAAMREVIGEPFVGNARARGLPERAVLHHAGRASLTSVITLGGLYLPAVVGGAVFVESVFGWHGMGLTLIDGVNERDYTLVSAIVVVGSALTVVASICADLLREVIDPRLRLR
jgi:peptide/nickel transport system permease protein